MLDMIDYTWDRKSFTYIIHPTQRGMDCKMEESGERNVLYRVYSNLSVRHIRRRQASTVKDITVINNTCHSHYSLGRAASCNISPSESALTVRV